MGKETRYRITYYSIDGQELGSVDGHNLRKAIELSKASAKRAGATRYEAIDTATGERMGYGEMKPDGRRFRNIIKHIGL